MQLWAVLFFINHCKYTSKDLQGRSTICSRPTLNVLTGYTSSRPMTRTSGCYYSF